MSESISGQRGHLGWCLGTMGLLVLFAGAASQAAPIMVTLYSAGDTVIRADQADDNFGAFNRIWVGHNGKTTTPLRRALVKFDLSSIPGGSTITSASLQMVVTDSHNVSSGFGLYRTLVNWGEGAKGSKGGALATAGEASWNNRIFGTAAWGTPGGLAGTDYQSAASASQTIATTGTFTWASTSSLVADAQYWLANPTKNYGWFLISSAEGTSQSVTRFATKEDSTQANRPALTITYNAPVPEPSSLALLGLGALALLARNRRTRE